MGNIEPQKPKLDLHPETLKSVWGVIFLVLFLITLLSFWGLSGKVGQAFQTYFNQLFGKGIILVPVLLLIISGVLFVSQRVNLYYSTLLGSLIFLCSAVGFIELLNPRFSYLNQYAHAGGYLGFLITYPLLYLFGFWAVFIILLGAFIISFSIILNMPLNKLLFYPIKKQEAETVEEPPTLQRQIIKVPFHEEKIKMREEISLRPKKKGGGLYELPSLDLLERESGKPQGGDVKAYSNIIKKTLANFGIEVDMGEVNIGPTVTQYTLKPAQGVKISKIAALNSDLSLALAAHPVRIEAPIPGRSLVGIEIPNRIKALVRLRSLLEDSDFLENASPLTFALGRDVAGQAVYADLEKMPHLLIAGSTGSGKSVAIHSIICNLLYRNYPNSLKFLIIDPKRVELSIYNDLPHLIAPIVTEKEKAIQSLRWAVKEMERRYEVISQTKSRDINSYNAYLSRRRSSDEELMPYLVIIIDELADLMFSYPREVEGSIIRLAQMARAVGLHLIISTQRPSVDVITGLIKANITSRIAFQVATQVDSRTILDMAGSEKLLGNGDLLYLAGDTAKPRRLQGSFVSEKEVKKVTDYLREASKNLDMETEEINFLAPNKQIDFSDFQDNEDNDELYEEAKKVVIQAGKASASLLQRRLSIGYARAARLLDIMEERGLIGPTDGAKPRLVFVSKEKE